MKVPEYEIATEIKLYDYLAFPKWEWDDFFWDLFQNQQNTLKEKGYTEDGLYKIHFFESYFNSETTEEMTILEATEMLAIKDGADLVQYNNGNYGFIAYYNGRANGFEILEVA